MSQAEAEREGTRWQVDARLIEELAQGATLAKTADAAGCSLSTAKRRTRDPAFRAQVVALQDEARRDRAAAVGLVRGGNAAAPRRPVGARQAHQ